MEENKESETYIKFISYHVFRASDRVPYNAFYSKDGFVSSLKILSKKVAWNF